MKMKLLVMAALMGLATVSVKAGVFLGVSVGLPLPVVTASVGVYPAPAVVPMVVAAPAPVMVPAPAPVVVAAPVYPAANYVYSAPGYYYGRVVVPACWHYRPRCGVYVRL